MSRATADIQSLKEKASETTKLLKMHENLEEWNKTLQEEEGDSTNYYRENKKEKNENIKMHSPHNEYMKINQFK